jgi:rhodanese-related sulfurtransferase/predicted DNA-binding ribbon-helix-helix protein
MDAARPSRHDSPMTGPRPEKRSLTLQGHRTSVSLEPAFWEAFRRMAAAEGLSANALAARIDADRAPGTGLATAIRLAVLDRALAGLDRDRAGHPATLHQAENAAIPRDLTSERATAMKSEDLNGTRFEHWTAQEVRDAFERNEIVVIDVRTPQEFMFEHVEGALLAPMATFRPENLPGQQGKRIVFHCGSGVRSRRVAEACAASGMSPVAHLEGGFAAWKAAGLPFIATDPATGAPRRAGG